MKHVLLKAPGVFDVVDGDLKYHNQFTKYWPLFKVDAVGICRTDKFLTHKPAVTPVVLGHEIVCHEEINGEKKYYVINNEISCGQCSYCVSGETSHCSSMLELGVNEHGGYAEYIRVPRGYLVNTDIKPLILNTLVEPLTCALHGYNKIDALCKMSKNDKPKVLIIGSGLAGKLIAHLILTSNLDVKLFIYDVSGDALKWCEDNEKITPLAQIKSMSMDIVIECTGTPTGIDWGFQAAKKAGVILFYGVPSEVTSVPFTALELFQKELTVTTSMAGCTKVGPDTPIMDYAVEYIKANKDFFMSLIGKVITLDEVPQELIEFKPIPGTRTIVNVSNEE